MSAATEIAAAIVSLVQDSGTRQTVQVTALAGETLDDVEYVQPYGFTSVPKAPGATGAPEAVIVFLGDRSKGIVIAVDDRRYRLVGLQAGEVALYDDQGSRVHFRRADPAAVPPRPASVVVVAPLVELGDENLGLLDGVVHGSGIDPFTGLTYTVLGNASAVVKAKK